MKSIEISSLGELKPHPDIPERWLISEPKAVPFFDSQEFEFVLDGDLENDKDFLIDADKAVQNFLNLKSDSKFDYTDYVFQNYLDFTDATGEGVLELKDKTEIWNYVYPSVIFTSRRSRRDKNIYIEVHCGCEWEIEHGLQLVFRRGLKLTRVSEIDGHSTEADAYDKPDSEDELLSKF